jgi:DNA-binding GntR family transcriptional regulator
MRLGARATSRGAEQGYGVSLAPINARNLHSEVYLRLKSALMAGQFAPGQTLLIRDLAEQLGTSPMPVRQALSRLVSEHALVEDDKVRASVRVPPLSAERFEELLMVRKLVEAEAAALAAERATAADIRKLRSLNEAVKRGVRDGNITATIQANFDFHFAIYRLTRNVILERAIESLWLQSGPYFRLLVQSLFESLSSPPVAREARRGSDEALARNDRIIAALENNDPADARVALSADIDRTAKVFLQLSPLEREAPAKTASRTRRRC